MKSIIIVSFWFLPCFCNIYADEPYVPPKEFFYTPPESKFSDVEGLFSYNLGDKFDGKSIKGWDDAKQFSLGDGPNKEIIFKNGKEYVIGMSTIIGPDSYTCGFKPNKFFSSYSLKYLPKSKLIYEIKGSTTGNLPDKNDEVFLSLLGYLEKKYGPYDKDTDVIELGTRYSQYRFPSQKVIEYRISTNEFTGPKYILARKSMKSIHLICYNHTLKGMAKFEFEELDKLSKPKETDFEGL